MFIKKCPLFFFLIFLVSFSSLAIDRYKVRFDLHQGTRHKFGFVVVFADTQQEAILLAFQKMRKEGKKYSIAMRSIENTGPGNPHENDGEFFTQMHFYIGDPDH